MLCTRSTISQWNEIKNVQKLVNLGLQIIAIVNLNNYHIIVQQGLEIHNL